MWTKKWQSVERLSQTMNRPVTLNHISKSECSFDANKDKLMYTKRPTVQSVESATEHLQKKLCYHLGELISEVITLLRVWPCDCVIIASVGSIGEGDEELR